MCNPNTTNTNKCPNEPYLLLITHIFVFLTKRYFHDCVYKSATRVQPTVTFPIGNHVNVLHDYKKTRPSKIMKLLTCRWHHLIDMLVEFSQNHIFLTLLKCLKVPYPSMFTNFCINYYAHTPCGEKIARNPSTY